MGLKLEVEFDNYDEEDGYTKLKASDVVLDLNGVTLVPVSMFDGRHATYDLPDGASEDDLIEALEKSSWCYTGISEAEPDEPGGPS